MELNLCYTNYHESVKGIYFGVSVQVGGCRGWRILKCFELAEFARLYGYLYPLKKNV